VRERNPVALATNHHATTPARKWSRTRVAVKRTLDVVGGVVAIIVLSPLYLVLGLLVLVFEGRPVIFPQIRVGRYGKPFTMYKFRSMVTDAPERLHEVQEHNVRTGPLFKVHRDPRVTRVGRFLRVTSLDELPQFLNVLGGSMSLVGPRPALFEEREQFPQALLERENLRPGITGLWQVNARLDPDFDAYHRLDLEYVRTYTFWGDLALLLKTPIVVVRDAWHHVRGTAKLPGSESAG